MSILDKIRSFSETRMRDAESITEGAFTYGEIRELWRLLNELGRSHRLKVEARVEDHGASQLTRKGSPPGASGV